MNSSLSFSAARRSELLQQVQYEVFDVIVLGGGITGAGIALDAISRGLTVALIEKHDFASGTSSRSTKLVHGGLRYLEKLQLRFVALLGRERTIIHQNATHNVIPVPVLLPIKKGGKLKKPLAAIGLFIYDVLAGVKNEHKARWLSRDILIKKYPQLNSLLIKGAFRYYEFKTNDGRLVIDILKESVSKGAFALNFIDVTQLTKNSESNWELQCFDTISNQSLAIRSRILVNATGPWCGQVMSQFQQLLPKKLFHTKGIHLVVSRNRFPINDAFYFDAPDQRMIFAIPRQNHVYIGTTDTPFSGDLSHPGVSSNDALYLLQAVNQLFAGLNLELMDILAGWAGIRPLIASSANKPGEISRKEEIFISPDGIITITGGKLTGYRLMAKKTVTLIFKQLKKKNFACQTHKIRISGNHWQTPPDQKKLVEIADQYFDFAKQTGISVAECKNLFYRYGTNLEVITEKAYEWLRTEPDPKKLWIKAEVWYSVEHEMTTDLAGFFIYRTEKVLFETHELDEQIPRVAQVMAEILHWNTEEMNRQINEFNKLRNDYLVS